MMSECKYPIRIRNPNYKFDPIKEYSHLKVPCGKCMICKSRKSRDWIFRLKQELQVATSAFFVTLTYSDENLLYSESGIATLHKPDFQNYIKRLRKDTVKETTDKVTYFACGEYGLKTKRPHYHAIILNTYSPLIEKNWQSGQVHIGTVTEDSIAYTTKYIMKQNEEWEKALNFDKSFQREFVLMSKGIGKNYFEKPAVLKYHKNNLDQNYVTDEKGFKYPIPRYYKELSLIHI